MCNNKSARTLVGASVEEANVKMNETIFVSSAKHGHVRLRREREQIKLCGAFGKPQANWPGQIEEKAALGPSATFSFRIVLTTDFDF